MKIHQKRGILVDNKCPRKFVKNVHENSPYENVQQNSLILNSLSTGVFHFVRRQSHLTLNLQSYNFLLFFYSNILITLTPLIFLPDSRVRLEVPGSDNDASNDHVTIIFVFHLFLYVLRHSGIWDWYYVTKNVLTYCEKKLFY